MIPTMFLTRCSGRTPTAPTLEHSRDSLGICSDLARTSRAACQEPLCQAQSRIPIVFVVLLTVAEGPPLSSHAPADNMQLRVE